MTITELADIIAKNHKTNKWMSGTETVTLSNGAVAQVGIKAFGKWLQIARCGDVSDSGCFDIKTVKAFKTNTIEVLESVTRHVTQ